MPVVVSGVGGSVRWGYQLVATLGPWAFEHGYLRAPVVTSDPFRLTQSGLTFVVHQGGQQTVSRRIDWLRVTDGVLTARLGPKE